MTAAMYEQLRKRRPDLRLPAWRELRNTDRHRAKRLWPDDLVGRRAAKLMTRETGTTDRVKVFNPHWIGAKATHRMPY